MNPTDIPLPPPLQAPIRTFMCACLMDAFATTLGPELSMVIGVDRNRGTVPAHESSAFALCSILNAIVQMCTEEAVEDEESLQDLLENIQVQFSTTSICRPAAARAEVSEILEHWFATAEKSAWSALAEARAGFPVSGGDFTRWRAFANLAIIAAGQLAPAK